MSSPSSPPSLSNASSASEPPVPPQTAAVRLHLAMIRALMHEVETRTPSRLADAASAQLVDELRRLGARIGTLADALEAVIVPDPTESGVSVTTR